MVSTEGIYSKGMERNTSAELKKAGLFKERKCDSKSSETVADCIR